MFRASFSRRRKPVLKILQGKSQPSFTMYSDVTATPHVDIGRSWRQANEDQQIVLHLTTSGSVNTAITTLEWTTNRRRVRP